jgi:hypothetical protein
MKQYIGSKKVRLIEDTGEKTPGGTEIVKVTYDDNTAEHFSKLMFDKVVDTKPCDATVLRDRRVAPVCQIVQAVLREWGLKVGELPYLSTLLNQSLNSNTDQALLKLVSEWMPRPLSLDDIDYIAVDRILKS